jgi:hypothetical protein
MKEISKYDRARLKPYEAVGKVCVDLTDLRTGKVIQREQGKNMVFPAGLYCGGDWVTHLSSSWLVMNDDDTPVDINMPYLLGGTIGYGQPSQAASGLYRGAYNPANQVLAEPTVNSIRWKFQYEFTSSQAIGTIKNIGLTHQYNPNANIQYTPDMFRVKYPLTNKHFYTHDGRYCYQITDAGVITKSDVLTGAVVDTIDVSAIVGSSASDKKAVGVAPATGLYYVCVYSTTPANRKMYVFSDSTFTTNTATYTMSNNTFNHGGYCMYVYGDKAFFPRDEMVKVDFVNDLAPIEQTAEKSWILANPQFSLRNTFGYGKYIVKMVPYNAGVGFIYDMEKEDIITSFNSTFAQDNTYGSFCVHPLVDTFLPCLPLTTGIYTNCAKTARVLDTPVEKTSANGLTATYELEVFWDL